MPVFCCGVCHEALYPVEKTLKCPNGHSYDMNRHGYVCLMPMGPGGKRHGDDQQMIECRRRFLEKGFYEPIRQAVIELATGCFDTRCDLADVGCGEGWYAQGLLDAMHEKGIAVDAVGIDISRDALRACARRECGIRLAVASAAHLPLRDGSCDLVLNLFSPPETGEYARVLRRNGYLLRALPREEHLFGLKKAVYATPYRNPVPPPCPPGFAVHAFRDVDTVLHLRENQDICDLFRMTPYWYKTGRDDQARLEALSELDAEVSVRVELLRRV